MTKNSKGRKTLNLTAPAVRKTSNAPKKKQKNKKGGGGDRYVGQVASLIADPCGHVLVGGQYGTMEGPVARCHKSFTHKTSAGATTCGFVLWAPGFTPTGGSGAALAAYERNMFLYGTEYSSSPPANSTSSPFGSESASNFYNGTSMFTACNQIDPAGDLQDQMMVQDIRALSACLRFSSIGKLVDMSGQIAIIGGLSAEALVPLTAPNTLSVDSLFNYSIDSFPITRDAVEVKWRPDSVEIFRPAEDGAIHVYSSVSGQKSVASETSLANQPNYIGIAWRGLDPTATQSFVIDAIKNVEFRLRPISGLAHTPPTTNPKGSVVNAALGLLDRTVPNWQSEHAKSFSTTLSEIAFGAAGSALPRILGKAGGFLSGLMGAPGGSYAALTAL